MSRPMDRREFLTRTGAVAAAAAAGLAAPDLVGERTGSGGVLPRPAWVRPAGQPQTTIDDATYARFDKRRTVFFSGLGGSYAGYAGVEAERALMESYRGAAGKLAIRPGFRPRDRALAQAAATISSAQGGPNAANQGVLSWLPILPRTDEELPAGEWSDPRQASRDVKTAARFFGAALVGLCRLDPRHVYSHDLDGKAIAFEDVDQPYEARDRRVIPTRCRYVVVYAVRMSGETVKRAPTALATAASSLAYSELTQVGASLAEFLRLMGYTAIPCVNDTAATIPLAVEAGLGELGRHNRLITPEYGPMVRLGKVFTDLPLETDGPIDAGVQGFCRACGKCAEACPAGALSFAPAPSFETRGPWNNPGHRAWFEDSVKCYAYTNEIATTCMICFSVCPYGKKARAAAHGLVKATIARTELLNGVLRSVDDAFGYGGQKSPDEWWNLNLPPLGWD